MKNGAVPWLAKAILSLTPNPNEWGGSINLYLPGYAGEGDRRTLVRWWWGFLL